ncbi:hypothetical protein, partial [Pseudomonas lactis]|uniref:hypothetical protein n=1 Tax=Pseudomonas lactis TaxID=1615674 RepID=UPI001CC21974
QGFESPRGRHDYPLCGIFKGHSIIEWPFCLSGVWPIPSFITHFSVLTGGRACRLPNIIMVIIFNP